MTSTQQKWAEAHAFPYSEDMICDMLRKRHKGKLEFDLKEKDLRIFYKAVVVGRGNSLQHLLAFTDLALPDYLSLYDVYPRVERTVLDYKTTPNTYCEFLREVLSEEYRAAVLWFACYRAKVARLDGDTKRFVRIFQGLCLIWSGSNASLISQKMMELAN